MTKRKKRKMPSGNNKTLMKMRIRLGWVKCNKINRKT